MGSALAPQPPASSRHARAAVHCAMWQHRRHQRWHNLGYSTHTLHVAAVVVAALTGVFPLVAVGVTAAGAARGRLPQQAALLALVDGQDLGVRARQRVLLREKHILGAEEVGGRLRGLAGCARRRRGDGP